MNNDILSQYLDSAPFTALDILFHFHLYAGGHNPVYSRDLDYQKILESSLFDAYVSQ